MSSATALRANEKLAAYIAKTVDFYHVPFTSKIVDKKYIIALFVIIPFLAIEIPGIVSYKTTRYPIDRCYSHKNTTFDGDYSRDAMEPFAMPVYNCVRCIDSTTFQSDIGTDLVVFFMIWFVFVALGVIYTVFFFIEHTSTAQKFLPYGIVVTNNRKKLGIIICVTVVFFIIWAVYRVKFNQWSYYNDVYSCVTTDPNDLYEYRLETSEVPTGGEIFVKGILPLLFGYVALIKFYINRMEDMYRDVSAKDLLKDNELMLAFANTIKYKCSYREIPGVLCDMRMKTDHYTHMRWYSCMKRYKYAHSRHIAPEEMPALVQALHDANKLRSC